LKVDRVTAQVRVSQDTGHGAWKSIEIGAEATVDEEERWSEALAHLYADLGRELKTLWSYGNGHKAQESSQDSPPSTVAAPQSVERSNGQTELKQYTRANNVWWSHKTAAGKWIREQ